MKMPSWPSFCGAPIGPSAGDIGAEIGITGNRLSVKLGRMVNAGGAERATALPSVSALVRGPAQSPRRGLGL